MSGIDAAVALKSLDWGSALFSAVNLFISIAQWFTEWKCAQGDSAALRYAKVEDPEDIRRHNAFLSTQHPAPSTQHPTTTLLRSLSASPALFHRRLDNKGKKRKSNMPTNGGPSVPATEYYVNSYPPYPAYGFVLIGFLFASLAGNYLLGFCLTGWRKHHLQTNAEEYVPKA
ncbi:hypothetical protein B0T22DRAFT_492096 [Podospora appendiculata]|uniref:Uncharacterized protein n=1 Tax=Podospora appendiculata TaxID=314037 RepID=A0AAE1CA39_9PEZI|nr:hypothetical protein B0T22DRAFT_492096 [Podospora appendiculata]